MDDLIIHKRDATNIPDLLDNSVDLTITDPPYLVLNRPDLYRGKKLKAIQRNVEFDHMTFRDYTKLIDGFTKETYRYTREGGTFISFMAIEYLGLLKHFAEKAGFTWRMALHWIKKNPAPKIYLSTPQSAVEVAGFMTKGKKNCVFNASNGGKCRNIYEYPLVDRTRRVHPTQKPFGLIEEWTKLFSNIGDLVADPFAGSGVVGEVARMNSRRYFISDLDVSYVEKKNEMKIQYAPKGWISSTAEPLTLNTNYDILIDEVEDNSWAKDILDKI